MKYYCIKDMLMSGSNDVAFIQGKHYEARLNNLPELCSSKYIFKSEIDDRHFMGDDLVLIHFIEPFIFGR